MWPLEYLAIHASDITIGTIGSLISAAIVVALAIFWRPFREMCDAIRKWITLMVKNPRLNVQVELGATLGPILQKNFIGEILDSLNSIQGITPREDLGSIIRFRRSFNKFDVDIEIIPESSYSEDVSDHGEDSGGDTYQSVSIIFRTNNLKLRDFKEGLARIQAFIFQEMNLAINRKIRMDLDDNRESIIISFDEFPRMLKFIKELNVDSLTVKDQDISITLKTDKIRINGKMLDPAIEKIEKLIKSNLGA
ncbi:MAG: hypothetical protein A4E49_01809 [Methanosaeta sp. PtaU1.Bin112]|nr:MAG: hypothetical protein A4E49_01809 [Methanosaeta sp. PtaU1.Bin112]